MTKEPLAKFKPDLWKREFGTSMKGNCLCCTVTPISSNSYVAGHIQAEANGGEASLNNLMPICKQCNLEMGQRYMIDYALEKYGITIKMNEEMTKYHKKIKNMLVYETDIANKVKTNSDGLFKYNSTPLEFVESIRPIIEFFIGRGYINPLWTDEEYSKFMEANRPPSNSDQWKPSIKINDEIINGEKYKELYLGYSNLPPDSKDPTYLREIRFIIHKYATEDFPEYKWEGWVYYQPGKTYAQLTPYNLYIHRGRNYRPYPQ